LSQPPALSSIAFLPTLRHGSLRSALSSLPVLGHSAVNTPALLC
jgi:hypothetical protein